MDVEASLAGVIVATQRDPHEIFAINWLPGRFHQACQNLELGIGAAHQVSMGPDFAASSIEMQVADFFLARGGICRPVRAPQDRPDPCNEFARVKRLREIVIGSLFKAGEPILFTATRCQHQDRQGGFLAQGAQDFEPGQFRELYVKDHDVVRFL